MQTQQPQIDYSSVPLAEPETIGASDWEPPRRVFFGKKDPATGRMEKEPTYSYVALPAMMYRMDPLSKKIVAAVAKTDTELKKLISVGYTDTPGDFGFVGAPSKAQLQEMEQAAAKAAKAAEGAMKEGKNG